MKTSETVFAAEMLSNSIRSMSLILSLGLLTVGLSAKDKHGKPTPQDQILVIAHISAAGGDIVRFVTTQHYRRNYLYAEHQAGKTVTLIDITDLNRPTTVAEMSDPAGGADNLVAAAGNVALVAGVNQPSDVPVAAQTFRILSFADPMHPAVEQEFRGVTAMARDDKRGLIFLANSDGIWILQQQYAMDPDFEKQWEHDVLGAH